VPEMRRLILAISGPESEREFRLGWSLWRRAHQAVAARCRAAKRALQHKGSLPREPLPTERVPAPTAAKLTDAEWESIRLLLPHKPPTGRPYHEHRRLLDGILWVARTGSSWREMPEEEFGKWETAYRRYRLWLEQGLWKRILEALGEQRYPGPATKGGDLSL
jgi:transposase